MPQRIIRKASPKDNRQTAPPTIGSVARVRCSVAPTPERHALENSPGTVAVVDDDPSMRRSVERLLNANGFVTEGYASAEAFLGKAHVGTIRCIVLDIHLGDMSGIELWQHLKQSDLSFPVIFITAMDDETLERETVKAGCIAYLQKPFPAESLIAAVNRALRRFSID